MLHSTGNDVHLPWPELDVAGVQSDGQGAAQDEEELVRVGVAVPGELPFGLDHPDVVVVQNRHRAR